VIVCEPVVSDDVITLALPPLRVVVPNTMAPDLNVTEPVGVPDVDEVTAAVNVTAVPDVEGFCEDVNVVLVAPFVTTWDIADDVLPALLASPLYTTVIVRMPTASAESVSVAVPPLNVCVPNVAAPFLKTTVPVGVGPEAEVTVAVKVTACP
jgi:hypothetical protein